MCLFKFLRCNDDTDVIDVCIQDDLICDDFDDDDNDDTDD